MKHNLVIVNPQRGLHFFDPGHLNGLLTWYSNVARVVVSVDEIGARRNGQGKD
jgi:hypothetical protein